MWWARAARRREVGARRGATEGRDLVEILSDSPRATPSWSAPVEGLEPGQRVQVNAAPGREG